MKNQKIEREIIIDTEQSQERRVAVVEDKVLEEYYIERDEQHRHMGSVYKGRVENIIPAINAAFVDIGLEKNGFIHIDDVFADNLDAMELDDEDEEGEDKDKEKEKKAPQKGRGKSRKDMKISDILKEKQEIIVQVVKEPISTKGCRLTTDISLPGRFLVLMPFEKQIAVSRRISNVQERKRLRQMAKEVQLPEGCGLIIRTAAEGCTKKAFENDVAYLVNTWKEIEEKHRSTSAPALLHPELDLVLRTIRDSYGEDVSRIVVNTKEDYDRVMEFVKSFVPEAKSNVRLYEGDVPIFERFNVQKDIDRAFRRNVWLKSGGYIVIDQTEAMIAIDVNSGRHTSSDNQEETVTKTNLEAADEIARQLKLRNIGGLVVVDFIDMHSKQNQKEVVMRLQSALKKDKAKSSILPLSEFGLLEMTRQRVTESIRQSVYDECPYCHGRGLVKSLLSICLELQRALQSLLSLEREKDVRIDVNPSVAASLRDNLDILKKLEEQYKANLTITSNPKMDLEDFKFYDALSGKALQLKRR